MTDRGVFVLIRRRLLPPRRALLLLTAAAVIGAGLTVHGVGRGAAADFAADALYASLACLLVWVFWPRLGPMRGAILAFLACTGVELAQLTGGPAALAAVFPPARLLLGTTFTAVDLIAYAVGVAAVYAADRIRQRHAADSGAAAAGADADAGAGADADAPVAPPGRPPAGPPAYRSGPAEPGVALPR